MRNKLLITIIAFFTLNQTAFAEMELFVSADCPHCKILQDEIAARGLSEQFKIQIYEIYNNAGNRNYYLYKSEQLGYKNGQVPLLVDGEIYQEGTLSILEYLENLKPQKVKEEEPDTLNSDDSEKLNELLKTQVKELPAELEPSIAPDCSQDEAGGCLVDPAKDDSKTTKILGIVAIVFGFTLFGTIIWRAQKNHHSN